MKWQYLIVRFNRLNNQQTQNQLNQLGLDGWELVFRINKHLYFRRTFTARDEIHHEEQRKHA